MEGKEKDVEWIGGKTRACGGRSKSSSRLGSAAAGEKPFFMFWNSYCLHSKGGSLVVMGDCLGDPTGVKIRRGDNVGDVSGVNKNSLSDSMLATDRAGDGGLDFANDLLGDGDDGIKRAFGVDVDSVAGVVRCTRFDGCKVCLRSPRFLLGEVWIRICRVNSSERENRFSQPAKVHR